MKAMGHADIKTTMNYMKFGKSHIRKQVERPYVIHVPTTATVRRDAPSDAPYKSLQATVELR
jgi:hypothetical protein